MSKETIKHILTQTQEHGASHQKYLLRLEKYFNEIPNDEFLEIFIDYLKKIFYLGEESKRKYVEHTLEFCGCFVKLINEREERNATLEGEESNNEFLSQIIRETLKYTDSVHEIYRYNACLFITILLKHLGDASLSNTICDNIQQCMLLRLDDSKNSIRLQAITALVRLQDPRIPDCPVINSYIPMLSDPNAQIRKEVVNVIAPNALTVPKIRDATRDCDDSVRKIAYARCGDIGPKKFRIEDRHIILINGFNESNANVRKFFEERLLEKWYNAYNDIVALLTSIKLDADENDIKSTFELSKNILNMLLKIKPINDIIDQLPIENNKLIAPKNLTNEVATFWYFLVDYLRKENDLYEYLEKILPELTVFCNYIQEVIKYYSEKTMEEWEYLEYQSVLLILFNIIDGYDFSDEVGRQTLHKLISSLLENHKFVFKVVSKIISILNKLIRNPINLSNQICEIISEIRDPMVPVTEDVNVVSNHPDNDIDFEMAQLNVKIHRLDVDQEDAVAIEDFRKAAQLQTEITKLKNQLAELKQSKEPVVVHKRILDNSKETACRCLDILNSILILPTITQLTPSLRNYLEFVVDLLKNEDNEVHWRVLKSIGLYCIIDKTFAEEYAKIFTIPIKTYSLVPYSNKMAVITSVEAISDLLRLYGINMLCPNNDKCGNTTKRQLYQNDELLEDGSDGIDDISLDNIMNVILDMIDDEDEDIRDAAMMAIIKLCLNEFPIQPALICRIILKWFNPITDSKLQQKMGVLIERYAESCTNANETIEKAIIPILLTLLRAPKNSPLSDVDLDNVMKFLAQLTLINGTYSQLHTNIALKICQEIQKTPENPIMGPFAKMLTYLKIDKNNEHSVQELKTLLEINITEVEDKKMKKYLQKFLDYLNSDETVQRPDETNQSNETTQRTNETTVQTLNGNITRKTIDSDTLNKTNKTPKQTVLNETDSNRVLGKSKQIKRKKSRNHQKAPLTTIEESNSPKAKICDDSDENMTIETFSSPLSNNSAKENTKKSISVTIISETSSDSDVVSSDSNVRRSARNKKKVKHSYT